MRVAEIAMGLERTTYDEKHYVAVKPLVEEIGLRWEKVFLKIKKNKALSSTVATTAMVAMGLEF